MQSQDDYGYGVIPFFDDNGQWKVFLINQYGSGGDIYWTFPKGHAEANESPEQTALRELYEETALTPAQLFKDKTYEQRYSFKYKDTTINRVIVYYAGIVAVPDFCIQEDELKNAGWFTCDDAREKLTFEQTKKMFDAVLTDRGIM